MNGSGLGWLARVLGAVSLVTLVAGSLAGPAFAYDHRRVVRRPPPVHREWRPYPGYVAAPPVYAPPAVIYSPPPAPVYAPPIAPSLNVVIPLHL